MIRGAGSPVAPSPAYTLLEAALGTGVDRDLLERALTHRSFAYENGGLPDNERLEFLGDAVLGLVVAEALYAAHPELPEGQLAKLRARVVSARALADVAGTLDLGRWVRLGRGEQVTGGRDKPSILADTMEAVIGAIYLDRGIAVVGLVVRALFGPLMDAAVTGDAAADWKTSLQELTAARKLGPPAYRVTETGPDHAKQFTAQVDIAGVVHGSGSGTTKKAAELEAAASAYRLLGDS